MGLIFQVFGTIVFTSLLFCQDGRLSEAITFSFFPIGLVGIDKEIMTAATVVGAFFHDQVD